MMSFFHWAERAKMQPGLVKHAAYPSPGASPGADCPLLASSYANANRAAQCEHLQPEPAKLA